MFTRRSTQVRNPVPTTRPVTNRRRVCQWKFPGLGQPSEEGPLAWHRVSAARPRMFMMTKLSASTRSSPGLTASVMLMRQEHLLEGAHFASPKG